MSRPRLYPDEFYRPHQVVRLTLNGRTLHTLQFRNAGILSQPIKCHQNNYKGARTISKRRAQALLDNWQAVANRSPAWKVETLDLRWR